MPRSDLYGWPMPLDRSPLLACTLGTRCVCVCVFFQQMSHISSHGVPWNVNSDGCRSFCRTAACCNATSDTTLFLWTVNIDQHSISKHCASITVSTWRIRCTVSASSLSFRMPHYAARCSWDRTNHSVNLCPKNKRTSGIKTHALSALAALKLHLSEQCWT